MGLVGKLYDRVRRAEDERDFVRRIPGNRKELADYLRESDNIKAFLEQNPDKRDTLNDIVNETYDFYAKYLEKGWAHKMHQAGKAIGYVSDAWAFSGGIAGALNSKWLHVLAQVPDKAYGLVYGFKTGNYLDAIKNIAQGAVSYIPGLTVLDEGLNRIVRKRMLAEARTRFEKKVGIYQRWPTRVFNKVKSWYTNARDRTNNVFTPGYEPQPALSPA